MNAKVVVALLFSMVAASQPAFSAAPRKGDGAEPPPPALVSTSAYNTDVLADIVEVSPVIPRGPRDVIRDYELEMASIAAQLSSDLEVISNAVGKGQITKEQGESASGERYQVAMMQFQLFDALHAMLEEDIARTPAAPELAPSPSAETIMVAMPFSSLQLSPSLVEYLGLNPPQARSIQRLMDRQRPKTEPLMLQLRTISTELSVAIEQRQSNDNEGGAQQLAAAQARLLKKLMIANSRLQRRIGDVLNPQQRKQLDAFRRTGGFTVGQRN